MTTADLGDYTADSAAFADGSLWTATYSNGVISRIDPGRNAPTTTIALGTGAQAPFAVALAAGSGVWSLGLPPQPGGGDWAGALGSWTPHRTVAWNEQAAIVITVPSLLSFPFRFSFPFPPKCSFVNIPTWTYR